MGNRRSKFGDRDEVYIIRLCDEILGQNALRQHRFPFLKGDPGKNGDRRSLPVDAYYASVAPGVDLVVEYREVQHTRAVAIMDRKWTISGCTRQEQRARYDALRRTVLAVRGIRLLELDYDMFEHDRSCRLLRNRVCDEHVVAAKLRQVLA